MLEVQKNVKYIVQSLKCKVQNPKSVGRGMSEVSPKLEILSKV